MCQNSFLIGLIGSALLLASCQLQQESDVQLYALRYGESLFKEENVFHDGGDAMIPFAWLFWVVKDGSGIYLVDCGITDDALLRKWGISRYDAPIDLLQGLGVAGEDVTGIILSHLHGDHVDGCSSFPNATFYLQKKEYEAIIDAFAGTRSSEEYSRGYFRKHYEFLELLKEEGRLVLIDGTKIITPHISVELAPYHTKGTQIVLVTFGKRVYSLISDNAYLYENIDRLRHIGTTVDVEGNEEYVRGLQSRGPRSPIVLPGHDPLIFHRFPSREDGIVQIE